MRTLTCKSNQWPKPDLQQLFTRNFHANERWTIATSMEIPDETNVLLSPEKLIKKQMRQMSFFPLKMVQMSCLLHVSSCPNGMTYLDSYDSRK